MSDIQRSQRWQRRKDARPAELLDAALAEFFEKGFGSARLEDIATRAGVSKGTIYLYFSSKEDIFQALVKAVPQAKIEQLAEIAQDGSQPPEELLRRFLTLMGGLIRDERMRKFPRLLIAEAGRFPNLAEIYRDSVILRGVEILSGVIERGIAEGRFHAVNPQHAAYAAIAPLLFVAIWKTTFERDGDGPLDGESFVNQHIETFLRGLSKGETQ